jgi:hypothetical protein
MYPYDLPAPVWRSHQMILGSSAVGRGESAARQCYPPLLTMNFELIQASNYSLYADDVGRECFSLTCSANRK